MYVRFVITLFQVEIYIFNFYHTGDFVQSRLILESYCTFNDGVDELVILCW